MELQRITLLLALGTALCAGEPDPTEKPKPKAEAGATVTVTAEATSIEIVKTPNPVKVLTSQDLRQSASGDAAGLLQEFLPGQMLTNGGVGTAASLSLGGARNQDVTVLVDGLRFSDAAGFGGANLNALSLAGIERVEIQQGPCSARFGSESMGGVISFFSAGSAGPGMSGEIRVGLGSQGIRKGSMATAYGWGTGWARVTVADRQEDQPTETPNPYRMQSTHLGFGQTFGDNFLLEVNYRNGYQGVPIPYFKPESRLGTPATEWTYRDGRETRSRVELISANLRCVFSPTLTGEFTLGQAVQNRMEPHDPYPYSGPMDYTRFEPFDSQRNQVHGSLEWVPQPNMGLGMSGDLYDEKASISDYSGGKDRGMGHHLGLALEPYLEPTSNLRITVTLRHQWDRQSFQFKPGTESQPEMTSSETTEKVAANLLLGHGWRAYASVGTGFSAPFLYSVMYNHQNAAWNPGLPPLTPERSNFGQAGLTWAEGPWSFRLEGSRTTFTNMLFFDMNSWVYRNGGQVRIQGVEAGVAYRLERWGADGFYRNQERRDLDAPDTQLFSSDAVFRRPFQSLGIRAFWAWDPFRADVRWTWFGSRYEYNGGSPASIVADKNHFNDLEVSFTWDLRQGLSLALRGQHLLQSPTNREEWLLRTQDNRNDAYMVRGFPAQTRTVSLEARYRF